MADFIQVAARLSAVDKGRAQRIAAERQIVIQPDAMVLTLLSMAGEDTSVHAIAVGPLGRPPLVRIVADPRRRDDQYDLLRWLLPLVETYYADCFTADSFPQIWVSSGGALGHLDTLADRLRFTDDPEIQRLGALLTYAGERSPIAGQQTLISATSALRAHYATGQQEAEDEHLGTLLVWIDPPGDRDLYAAVAMAEGVPMGVKTDPEFDRIRLSPAVAQFNAARKAGADEAELDYHRGQIQVLLESVVRPIYSATQRAAALLSAPQWPPSPALDILQQEEARAFADFMLARQAGHGLPYRDGPKAGALKIIARERAQSNVEAGTLRFDRAAREIGVARGRVIRATLVENRRERVRPHLFSQTMVLTTPQEGLHLRVPDVLWGLDGPTMALRVMDVTRADQLTRITGEVVKGKNTARHLQPNTVLDLGPEDPNWGGLGFEMGRASSRLQTPPWSHGEVLPAGRPSLLTRPNDLLAAVEALA